MPEPKSTVKLVWNGVNYTIREVDGIWKIQSRRATGTLFHSFGRGSAKWVEGQFYEFMKSGGADQKRKRQKTPQEITMADVIRAYEDMPKPVGDSATAGNVYRLKKILLLVLGKKDPADVLLDTIGPHTWESFQTIRQGGKLNFSDRQRVNIGINSALKCALSLFVKTLHPRYAAQGITFRPDITTVQWLPVPYIPPEEADDEKLREDWASLRHADFPLWLTIGLARFAGLRREEIASLRPGWIIRKKGVPYVDMRDRPDEDYQHKTGKPYLAIILDEQLAEVLESLDKETLAVNPNAKGDGETSRKRWFERVPQKWVRVYCPKAKKPLHRLRGLYLDQYREEQELAIAARLEAMKKASEAAGHTSTATTATHYFKPDYQRKD